MDFTTLINQSLVHEEDILDTSEGSTTPVKPERREFPRGEGSGRDRVTSNSSTGTLKRVTVSTEVTTVEYIDQSSSFLSTSQGNLTMNESMISLDSLKGARALFGQKKSKLKNKKNQSLNESTLSIDGPPVELSIDENSPGLLKIFGSKIKDKHHHKYKTVLASPSSTAKELVKEALDRYSLPKRSCIDYVLCDVLGTLDKFSPDEEHEPTCEVIGEYKWVEKGCRALADSEMPLTLQTLWKPEIGLSRRFELRLKSDMMKNFKDTQTRAMNKNVRRFQKTRANLRNISEEQDDSPDSPDEALTPTSSFSAGSRNSSQHNSNNSSSDRQETDVGEESIMKKSVAPPTDCPFLLLLRGYNLRDDSVIYYLSEQISIIGSSEYSTSTNNVNEKTEIVLNCPDVKQQHCWILKKTRSVDGVSDGTQNVKNLVDGSMVNIHPILGAMVHLNGSPIIKPCELKTGDLIAIGQHYLFLYKDLTDFKDLPRDLYWLKNQPGPANESYGNALNSVVERKELECSMNGVPCLNYQKQHEDELLNYILHSVDPQDGASFKLAPCYLACCMLDFCSDVYGKIECKKLVYKVIIAFTDYAREACDKLSGCDLGEQKLSLQKIFDLCHSLRPVAFIMANSLELLNCLENRKSSFGPINNQDFKGTPKDKVMVNTTEDQLFAMVEDIALQAFQESVYQITKALSHLLPTLLSSNPFQSSMDSPNRMPSAIQAVLDLLQGVLDTFSRLLVHPDVVEQLFGCLMFFTNSFLFNQIVDKGSSGNYLKWSRGAQIRGNLDAVESWLYQNSLQKVANDYLGRLNAVVDLLAMLKIHILRSDWRKLRQGFPQLSPAQLNFILMNYCLENRQYPYIWQPVPEEKLAAETEPFYESMDGAPPMTFPEEGYIIKPNLEVPDESVYRYVKDIATKYQPQPYNKKVVSASMKSSKNSWKQTRNRNTPSVTLMFTGPSHERKPSFRDLRNIESTEGVRNDYNYIMGNAIMTHPNAQQQQQQAKQRLPRHHFESPATSSSETLMRSSGTLKSNSVSHPKMVPPPLSFSGNRSKPNPNAGLHGDLVLGSGSSGTFSGGSQGSVIKAGPGFQDPRPPFVQTIGEPSVIPKVRPVPKKDFQRRPPVITKGGQFENQNQSPLSQHHMGKLASGSKEQHADDSVSVVNDLSPTALQFPRHSPMSELVPNPIQETSILKPSTSSAFVQLNSSNATQNQPSGYQNPNIPAYDTQDDLANKTFHAIDMSDNQSIDGATISEDREIAWYMDNPPDFITDDEVSEAGDTATIHDDNTLGDDMSETATAIFDDDETDYLVMVELEKEENGLGIGLIDGTTTSLNSRGVYIRTISQHSAAYRDPRVGVGDRVMSVDDVNISGMDYREAMQVIRNTGQTVRFVLAKCTSNFAPNTSASLC